MRSRINGFNFSAISTNFLFAGTRPLGSDHTLVPTKYEMSQCYQNVHNAMCVQQRLGSAWKDDQSDPVSTIHMEKARILVPIESTVEAQALHWIHK